MKKIIFLIFLFFIFNSCSTFKSVFKKESKSELIESTLEKKDSVKNKLVNQAINDIAAIKIPTSNSNDSIVNLLVNKKVDEILSTIDISKTSGDNSYRVWWDNVDRRIRVWVKVGKTESIETNTNSSKSTYKSLLNEVKTEWTKVKIPWWIYAVIIFFFRKTIFSVFRFIFPQLLAVNSLKELFTKKKSE